MKFIIIFLLTSATLFAQDSSGNTDKRMFGKDWLRLVDNTWEINANLDSLKVGDTLTLTQSLKTNLNTYRFIRRGWNVQYVNSMGKKVKWKIAAYWFPMANYLDINSHQLHPQKMTKYKLINDLGDKINFICVEIRTGQP